MNRDDKIAVFRYGIIAPVIYDESINRTKHFRNLAKKEFNYPGEDKPVSFRYRTFIKWLHLYRKHGYDGLKPTSRNDKGKSRKLSEHQAEHYFYNTIYRTVKNDSTVTVNNTLYETPAKYIGRKIEIRFPLDKPDDLRLFEDDKQCAVLKKLDKHLNSELKIRYSKKDNENKEGLF